MSPLFFLHGVGGSHAVWDRQLPYFTSLGYDVHAWDQPGYGGTPAVEPYDLEHVAAALERQLPAGPVVLIGHSMGGFVAQEAYARFPGRIRALALCFTSAAFCSRSRLRAGSSFRASGGTAKTPCRSSGVTAVVFMSELLWSRGAQL